MFGDRSKRVAPLPGIPKELSGDVSSPQCALGGGGYRLPWPGLDTDVLVRASFAAQMKGTDLFSVGLGHVRNGDDLQMESHQIDVGLLGGAVTRKGRRSHDALVL